MAIILPTEKSRLSCLWPPRDRISLSIHFVNAHRDAVPAVDNFESPQPDVTISPILLTRADEVIE
jgi:hypothetical protein